MFSFAFIARRIEVLEVLRNSSEKVVSEKFQSENKNVEAIFQLLWRKLNSLDELYWQTRYSLVREVFCDEKEDQEEIFDAGRHLTNCRVFWIVAFLLSFCTCSYLIYETYKKWENDPVLVTLNERSTPTWKVR